MKLYFQKILIFFIFQHFLIQTILSQTNDCEYTLTDGAKYNFSKLRKLTGDYEYVYSRYTYKANFCGSLNTKCITSPNTPAGLFLRGKYYTLTRLFLHYKVCSRMETKNNLFRFIT